MHLGSEPFSCEQNALHPIRPTKHRAFFACATLLDAPCGVPAQDRPVRLFPIPSRSAHRSHLRRRVHLGTHRSSHAVAKFQSRRMIHRMAALSPPPPLACSFEHKQWSTVRTSFKGRTKCLTTSQARRNIRSRTLEGPLEIHGRGRSRFLQEALHLRPSLPQVWARPCCASAECLCSRPPRSKLRTRP